MKTLTKTVLAMLAVGLLVAGAEGVALAEHNKPNLDATGHPGYAPDYNYPMETTQPGWIHEGQGGGYVGYPPDYSNVPNLNGGAPEKSGGYVGYPPDYSNVPNIH